MNKKQKYNEYIRQSIMDLKKDPYITYANLAKKAEIGKSTASNGFRREYIIPKMYETVAILKAMDLDDEQLLDIIVYQKNRT